MQRIVLSYIATQLATNEELAKAEIKFRELDKDGNGKLDRVELINGFKSHYGDRTESEVDKIMAAADLDGSGQIDFNEWKIATTRVVTKDRLTSAFGFFDKDGSG